MLRFHIWDYSFARWEICPQDPFLSQQIRFAIRRSQPSTPYLLFLLPYREHNSAGIFLLLLPTLAYDLDHVRKYKHRLY